MQDMDLQCLAIKHKSMDAKFEPKICFVNKKRIPFCMFTNGPEFLFSKNEYWCFLLQINLFIYSNLFSECLRCLFNVKPFIEVTICHAKSSPFVK